MITPANSAALRNFASAMPLLALSARELVISDGLCRRIGALVEGMASDQVAITTPSAPLRVITTALEAHRVGGSPLDTMHLVAHGRPGAFHLGGQWVDMAALLGGCCA